MPTVIPERLSWRRSVFRPLACSAVILGCWAVVRTARLLRLPAVVRARLIRRTVDIVEWTDALQKRP